MFRSKLVELRSHLSRRKSSEKADNVVPSPQISNENQPPYATDGKRKTEVDYSDFNVMGPWYPEPNYFRGKPCIVHKKGRDVYGSYVGHNGILWDRTPGVRLLNVTDGKLLLVDAEETFKYGQYHTCSYTWKEDRTEQDRQVKEIVRRVAETGLVDFLWIDAWCIDQDSDEDKSFNIQLMGKIFRYSCENFIMLLDCRIDSELVAALEYIGLMTATALSDFVTEDDDPRLLGHCIEEAGHNTVHIWMDQMIKECEKLPWGKEGFQPLVEEMLHISSHRWVTRIWTLQEVILAPVNSVIGANWACGYEAFEYGAGVLDWSLKKAEPKWENYSEARELVAGLVRASQPWRRLYHLGKHVRVGEIINRAVGRLCKYEEDRIYAIKGLLPYGDEIKVEYGLANGGAHAAYTLARVCSQYGDYSWAGGFNGSEFPGNTHAIAIPGITMMPRWIGSWQASEAFRSAEIVDAGVVRLGKMCPLESSSSILNATGLYGFDWGLQRSPEGGSFAYVPAAAATLAAFGAGGMANGYLSVRPDREHFYDLAFNVYMTTEEEVYETAGCLYESFYTPNTKLPEASGRVLVEVSRTLERLLPYGCKEASIVRVRRFGDSNGMNLSELFNLIYWPFISDLTGISALVTGEYLEYETFALVRREANGVLRRVGSAIAPQKGRISEFWGENQPVVEV